MNHNDVRFTDEHVRTYPNLVKLAELWLTAYEGEWSVLRDLKDSLEFNGYLTVAQARKVLNSMRSEPGVVWPEIAPTREQLALDAAYEQVQRQVSNENARKQLWSRRRATPLPTRFKLPFGVAAGFTDRVRVIHMIDGARSAVVYWPGEHRDWQEWFTAQIHWVCSGSISYHRDPVSHVRTGWPRMKMLTTEQAYAQLAVGDGWRWCAQCVKKLQKDIERRAAE